MAGATSVVDGFPAEYGTRVDAKCRRHFQPYMVEIGIEVLSRSGSLSAATDVAFQGFVEDKRRHNLGRVHIFNKRKGIGVSSMIQRSADPAKAIWPPL